MQAIQIGNRDLRVELAPSFGARVTSLVDARSERDWIAGGSASSNVGEDAAYLAAEAVGWDECFPTVSPWDARGASWGKRLRDHGDLWGRPWHLTAQATDSATLVFTTGHYIFERSITLDGPTLRADYRVTAQGLDPLPFMWAMHCLLSVVPEDRIYLPGVRNVRSTFVQIRGEDARPGALKWPGPNEQVPFPFDKIQSAEAKAAAKLYSSDESHSAWVGHGDQWLEISGDPTAAHFGIWLNYGGWPSPGDVHHIALEPTTAPFNHLGQALEDGAALSVEPGTAVEWQTRLTVHSTPPVGMSLQ